ncbi:MAG: hypothetical protein CMO26_02020 [Thiotrichales bacterium]|nr:hypothetical protein [Thiotrichales bacterium]|tara:strand:+ start:543 stop:1004 length:462 start_codon:yes stop_codon:yes gene_type:complete
MSKRISHSLLDPYIGPPIKKLYPLLAPPARFPPEGTIAIGHLSAIAGAVGFCYALGLLDLGLVAVIVMLAIAVLTNIKAKLVGEFALAAFGPTKFKVLLEVFAIVLCIRRPGRTDHAVVDSIFHRSRWCRATGRRLDSRGQGSERARAAARYQ